MVRPKPSIRPASTGPNTTGNEPTLSNRTGTPALTLSTCPPPVNCTDTVYGPAWCGAPRIHARPRRGGQADSSTTPPDFSSPSHPPPAFGCYAVFAGRGHHSAHVGSEPPGSPWATDPGVRGGVGALVAPHRPHRPGRTGTARPAAPCQPRTRWPRPQTRSATHAPPHPRAPPSVFCPSPSKRAAPTAGLRHLEQNLSKKPSRKSGRSRPARR